MERFRNRERCFTEIRTFLERGVYHAVDTLSMEAHIAKEPIPFSERTNGTLCSLAPGVHWGDAFDCAWVHFTGAFPDAFPIESERCRDRHWAVLIDLSAEGLVYNEAGEPVQGLTSATSRNEFPLGLWGKRTVERKDCENEAGRIDFWADFTCCDVEGQYRNEGRVKEACTAWVDDLCRDTFYDWVVCQSLFVGLMENGDPYGETVGAILEEAAAVFERAHGAASDGKDIAASDGALVGVSDADAFKRRDAYFTDDTPTGLDASGERLSILPDAETEPTKRTQLVLDQDALARMREILNRVLSQRNENSTMTYSSIGHSHLDLLFLWPERETYRKCARTIANVLRIMDIDPTYRFTLSQAPVYLWMREKYPSLYRKMMQRIREGRIEIVGALFVECDTNLPSGESLVRQLLYGKRFFRETYGQEMQVCFLPDVFGYSAALPQLLRLADVPYFTTNKLSMNDTNRFPRYTFWWYGIDGSKVLTHMLPENSYTSAAVPQMAIYGEYHYTDKDLCPRGLQLYGLGDGGGGPGLEHIERRRRMRDLKGCPPIEDESVLRFFKRIERGSERYRSWHGELYFERHQGTYTSIARQKLWNRTLERDLHALEYVAALANGTPGYAYPAAWLKQAWQDVLLYQFHDCLPGSSIPIVYEQTQKRYAELHARARELTALAMRALAARMGTAGEDGTLVLNPCAFETDAVLERDAGAVGVSLLPYELLWLGSERETPYKTEPLPRSVLENTRIRVVFDRDGTVSEIFDKETNRSLLPEGGHGNVLTLYPDELTHWDIQKDYLKETGTRAVCTAQSAYQTESGQCVDLTFSIGEHSTLHQTVWLMNGQKRVDFATEVEWNETYRMLRVAFETDVVSDRAACGIQFGHIDRPTHRNTSWDEAKFEVCAHKWVDMADASGGLALLSDCKYGYKIWDNVLDLCLLRSQNCPAEEGDRGFHRFTYAILPHEGGAWDGGVVREGYRLSDPPTAVRVKAGGGRKRLCPFRVVSGTVVLETVKKAEDSDDLILRLYEAKGGRTTARLALTGCEAIELCNLLEEPTGGPLLADADGVTLAFRPFEIKSVRVRRKGEWE